jgi:hypothetical protein
MPVSEEDSLTSGEASGRARGNWVAWAEIVAAVAVAGALVTFALDDEAPTGMRWFYAAGAAMMGMVALDRVQRLRSGGPRRDV